jgi:outer membrane protein OmpA-like peptidoglycan-associated protein
MYRYSISCSRLTQIAVVAGGLFLGTSAFAQSVRMFDDAPSVEQLRSILIPETQAGAGRTIVIQRPASNALQSPVRPAAAETVALPQPSVVTANPPSSRIAQPASEPSATPHESGPATEAGAVAFHINFAFNSAELPDSAHIMIDRVAQLMKEAPELKLRIEGHTDAAGPADYNLSLSQERALSVAQYLAAQGIARTRLILVGKGKTEPLTHDPYEPANRRVQFVRIG